MATADTNEATHEQTSTRRDDATGRGFGIAAGALLVTSMALAMMVEPGNSITGSELLTHYADDRVAIFVSWLAMQLAGVALLWFLAGVRTRLARHGEERHAAAAALGGAAFVALAYVSRAVAVAPAAFATFGLSDGVLDPNTARLLGIASYEILAGAGVASSVLVGAVAMAARRARLVGAGLARAGYVVAVLALFSSAAAYVPVALVGLWIAVLSARLPRSA